MSAPFEKFEVVTSWPCCKFTVDLAICSPRGLTHQQHKTFREKQRQFIEDAIREKLEREGKR